MSQRIDRLRARLVAAEIEAFEHYGVERHSEPLVLADPPLTTRVLRVGQGPATVLLHGANMTASVWLPLLPHLPGRSLYLVDLPGCGLSEPFDHTGIDLAAHQAAFVGSALDALGLERAALIGGSLGGMFALRFALEHPARVPALAMVTAPGPALPGARVPVPMALGGHPWVGRLMNAMPAPSSRMTRRMLAAITGPDSVRDGPEAMFDAVGAAMGLAGPSSITLSPEMFRWRTPHPRVTVTDDELAGCRVPTLLLWGEQDKVQPPAAGARAADLLPNGRLEVIPGGHGLWFDDPVRCGQILSDFLHETADAPGR
ncbi:MAG: alpha/beta hydrolase [Actinobacteria bacterium]|nr:alpha/beta hydrolase [Actinomycetota bacterium]